MTGLTLALAVGTIGLLVGTIGLLVVNAITARRQLRAYIALDEAIVTVKGTTITFELKFINAGQTPAHSFYAFADKDIFRKGDELPELSPSDEDLADKSVIGPGRKRTYVKDIKTTRSKLASIKRGELYGYIWGEARYRDIFGCKRYLKFTSRTGRDIRGDWVLQPTKGGEFAN